MHLIHLSPVLLLEFMGHGLQLRVSWRDGRQKEEKSDSWRACSWARRAADRRMLLACF